MEKLMRMVALVSVLGLALIGSAAGSATTTTTSQSFPIQFLSFVPCANGGSGEFESCPVRSLADVGLTTDLERRPSGFQSPRRSQTSRRSSYTVIGSPERP